MLKHVIRTDEPVTVDVTQMSKKAYDGWWICMIYYDIIRVDRWPLDNHLNRMEEKNEFRK